MKRGTVILACLCLAIGATIVLMAAGIIEVADESVHAPRWVLGLCGLVFLLGGFMMLAGAKSRFNALGAAILCGSFGLIGVWATFFTPDDAITGGVPFLSQSTNATIGRWLFGAGFLISFAIAWVALRQFIRWKKPAAESTSD